MKHTLALLPPLPSPGGGKRKKNLTDQCNRSREAGLELSGLGVRAGVSSAHGFPLLLFIFLTATMTWLNSVHAPHVQPELETRQPLQSFSVTPSTLRMTGAA